MKVKLVLIFYCMLLIFCGCSRRRQPNREDSSRGRTARVEDTRRSSNDPTIIEMRNMNGVYMVPCKINGVEMEFIFDTGASDITMSLTEALFLYKQGKLTDDDFIGSQQYQIADGSIHEGAIVILKKVEIGDRVLNNVKASIMDNLEAPLLLGQSALAKFGKILIDYNHSQIILE